MSYPDVCVVGGGPAGLASAIALRLQGHSVCLYEAALPPVDKACGEGLMPDSVRALRDLGVSLPAEAQFCFTGIGISDDKSSVAADFLSGVGVGVRRTVLHEALAARATELGVKAFWGVKRVSLAGDSLAVGDALFKPKLVVAADGLNSQLRRSAGLHRVIRERQRYAFRQHFATRPWSSRVEIHCGLGFQMYITPVSASEISVALISADSRLRLQKALTAVPELARRVQGTQPSSREKGGITISRSFRQVAKPGLALVGDASGSVDAITGEGIGLGFRQALALARAFAGNTLDEYNRMHWRLSLRPRIMSALLLRAASRPKLQARALLCLSRNPDLFARLLAIHVGDSSFASLVTPSLISAGLSFLGA
jgi:flavin-dependent dehydrogenase